MISPSARERKKHCALRKRRLGIYWKLSTSWHSYSTVKVTLLFAMIIYCIWLVGKKKIYSDGTGLIFSYPTAKEKILGQYSHRYSKEKRTICIVRIVSWRARAKNTWYHGITRCCMIWKERSLELPASELILQSIGASRPNSDRLKKWKPLGSLPGESLTILTIFFLL